MTPNEQKVLDFDPNNLSEPYATYAPGRRPAWRMHANRAQALQTVNGWPTAALYVHADGEWHLLVRKVESEHHGQCDRCGISTLHPRHTWSYQTRSRVVVPGAMVSKHTWQWVKAQGKVVDPPVLEFLCEGCRR